MESRGHPRNPQRCRDGDVGREVRLREVGVIQYNYNKANHLAARPFFEGLDHKAYPIIAIQEPFINPHTKIIRAPNGYLSICAQPTDGPEVRTAFLVVKSIPVSQWQVVEASGDLQAIQITTESGSIVVVNAYIPGPANGRNASAFALQECTQLLQRLEEAGEEILLLGDFNLHHRGGGKNHVVADPQADQLLSSYKSMGLHLLLPVGTATWQRESSLTTINLIFRTLGVQQRVLQCQAHPKWAQLPNHIPIETALDMQVVPVKLEDEWTFFKKNTNFWIFYVFLSLFYVCFDEPYRLVVVAALVCEGMASNDAPPPRGLTREIDVAMEDAGTAGEQENAAGKMRFSTRSTRGRNPKLFEETREVLAPVAPSKLNKKKRVGPPLEKPAEEDNKKKRVGPPLEKPAEEDNKAEVVTDGMSSMIMKQLRALGAEVKKLRQEMGSLRQENKELRKELMEGQVTTKMAITTPSLPQTPSNRLDESSWATVAARGMPKGKRTTAVVPQPVREGTTKKTQVVIHTSSLIPQARERFPLTNPAAARKALEESFQQSERLRGTKLAGMDMGASHIKLFFKNGEEKNFHDVFQQWSQQHMPGATIAGLQWYPVKVDRIPKHHALSSETNEVTEFATASFGRENGVSPVRMRRLGPIKESAMHCSVVVDFERREDATKLLAAEEVLFQGITVYAKPYARPQTPRQCKKCWQFTHSTMKCPRMEEHPVCRSCAGSHEDCKTPTPTCTNCGGSHRADNRRCSKMRIPPAPPTLF